MSDLVGTQIVGFLTHRLIFVITCGFGAQQGDSNTHQQAFLVRFMCFDFPHIQSWSLAIILKLLILFNFR